MNRPVRSVLAHVFKVPVDPPDAPAGAHTKVSVMRASPRYLTYRLLGLGCGALLMLALCGALLIAAIAAEEPAPLIVLAALLVIGVPLLLLGYLAMRIDYDLRYYVLTDRSLRVRQGAWVVDEKTLTFANVQNVRVTQGPLQRAFKISDVRVDTAGGGVVQAGLSGGHNMVIAGIENAEQVRDEILAHLRQRGAGAGLGDLDDERTARKPRGGFTAAQLEVLREVARASGALRAAAQRRGVK